MMPAAWTVNAGSVNHSSAGKSGYELTEEANDIELDLAV